VTLNVPRYDTFSPNITSPLSSCLLPCLLPLASCLALLSRRLTSRVVSPYPYRLVSSRLTRLTSPLLPRPLVWSGLTSPLSSRPPPVRLETENRYGGRGGDEAEWEGEEGMMRRGWDAQNRPPRTPDSLSASQDYLTCSSSPSRSS
jgi:hypothetical protein